MAEHPIQGLMVTAMENLKEMADVTKVVGDAVETADGHVIIPVSRVTLGFVTGGSEFETDEEEKQKLSPDQQCAFPFGGGSGGGVTIQPVAFLVVSSTEVRLLPVDRNVVLDRLIDLAPQVLKHIQELLQPQSIK
ncbi:MAG: sporulation protein YtfJ [Firmicutes bacterium]|nr:sporulation protein YtfJ [Bacillota bacterium]